MTERPKISINLTAIDKIIELAGWLAVLGIWILTLVNYSGLPDTIPVHFNGAGEPDGFGGKNTILAIPGIATILFVGMTILNKKPHLFNYPVSLSKENTLRQYRYATRMIRILKLVIVLISGLIVFGIIQYTKGSAEGLTSWFMPVTLLLLFLPVIFYLVKSVRAKAAV